MYSQQRRSERYRIIYTWKILEGLVPNCGIESDTSMRRGRVCRVPITHGRQAVKSLREQSFQMSGPKLFNCLPKYLRDINKSSKLDFKEQLDLFLATLPDQPHIGDLIPNVCNQFTAKPSNSLVDVITTIKVYGC